MNELIFLICFSISVLCFAIHSQYHYISHNLLDYFESKIDSLYWLSVIETTITFVFGIIYAIGVFGCIFSVSLFTKILFSQV